MCHAKQVLARGEVYTEALPRTAANKVRTLKWVPLFSAEVAPDAAFTVEEQGKKDRVYLCGEYVADRAFDGRCFWVRRAGSPEPYYVRLGRNEQDYSCDCAGGTYGKVEKCVHVLAIESAIANSWYPDPLDNPLFGNPVNPEDAPF